MAFNRLGGALESITSKQQSKCNLINHRNSEEVGRIEISLKILSIRVFPSEHGFFRILQNEMNN